MNKEETNKLFEESKIIVKEFLDKEQIKLTEPLVSFMSYLVVSAKEIYRIDFQKALYLVEDFSLVYTNAVALSALDKITTEGKTNNIPKKESLN